MKNAQQVFRWCSGCDLLFPVRRRALTREELLVEAKAASDAVAKYDEHLFRIRSWWMAIAALLIVGFLRDPSVGQTNPINLSEKSPQFAFFMVTAIGLGFWALDAMNKSLQLVIIHLSRDIEQSIFYEIPVFGPTKSRRFAMRDGRHFWQILKNLSEQSIAPFYILPILGAGLLFWVDHDLEVNPSANASSPSSEFWLTAGTSLFLVVILFISRYLRKGASFIDRPASLAFQRARKRRLRALFARGNVLPFYRFERIKGMQFHMIDKKSVIFLDYDKTWQKKSYVIDRDLVARHIQLNRYAYNLKSRKLLDFQTGSVVEIDKPFDENSWRVWNQNRIASDCAQNRIAPTTRVVSE